MLCGQFQITAKKDDMPPGLGVQVGFDDNDDIKRCWEIGVEELGLIGAGLDAIFDIGTLEILFRDMLVIHSFSIFTMRTTALVKASVRKARICTYDPPHPTESTEPHPNAA